MNVANSKMRDLRTSPFSAMGCIILSIVLMGRPLNADDDVSAPVVQVAEELNQPTDVVSPTLSDEQDDTPSSPPEIEPMDRPLQSGPTPPPTLAPAVLVETVPEVQYLSERQEEGDASSVNTEIKTARFDGVEPGVTSLEQLQDLWGEPVETQNEESLSKLVFERPPFALVEVAVIEDVVDSIIVRLEAPVDPTNLAEQIDVAQFTPAPVPDVNGRLLGQVYPERGILFVFDDDSDTLQVVQIIIEPISAEPFFLRAKHDFRHRYSQDRVDLEVALSLDPDYAEAHGVKAQLFAARGDWEASLLSAREAVRLEPSNVSFHLMTARAENENGNYARAVQTTRRLLDQENISDIDRAVARQQLGDLLAEGPTPDFDKAMEFHQLAIDLAVPIASHEEFAVRRRAKKVIVNAHLAVALDIARGNFQNKSETILQWLDQADVLIDHFVDADNGDSILRLVALRQRLAIQAGLPRPTDPTATIRTIQRLADQLVQSSNDTEFHETVDYELRRALYNGVRVEHARDQFPRAMQYALDVVGRFEVAHARKELAPRERIQLGELYYLAGAMQAIGSQNHEAASRLYDKSLELIFEPMPVFALSRSGEQGEWFVSMGVTFWQLDQSERAIRMTNQGSEFMKRAVVAGWIEESALGVPYGNLATMHRSLGNDSQADDFAELALQAAPADDDGVDRR